MIVFFLFIYFRAIFLFTLFSSLLRRFRIYLWLWFWIDPITTTLASY